MLNLYDLLPAIWSRMIWFAHINVCQPCHPPNQCSWKHSRCYETVHLRNRLLHRSDKYCFFQMHWLLLCLLYSLFLAHSLYTNKCLISEVRVGVTQRDLPQTTISTLTNQANTFSFPDSLSLIISFNFATFFNVFFFVFIVCLWIYPLMAQQCFKQFEFPWNKC